MRARGTDADLNGLGLGEQMDSLGKTEIIHGPKPKSGDSRDNRRGLCVVLLMLMLRLVLALMSRFARECNEKAFSPENQVPRRCGEEPPKISWSE